MDYTKIIAEKYGKEKTEELKVVKDPAIQNGSAAEGDMLKYFYNFTDFPDIEARFLGPGKTVKVKAQEVKTWLLEEPDGYQWLIPQWITFTEPDDHTGFKGFQNEPVGEFIYLVQYMGLENLPNGGTKQKCKVYKKVK